LLLDPRGGRAQRLDPLGGGLRVAAHGDGQQQRGAVDGLDRLADLGDARNRPQLGGRGGGRGTRGRLVQRTGAGRDQDIVDGRLVGELAFLDHDAGASRLTDGLVLRGGFLQPGRIAPDEAHRDEHHPQRHRPPWVLGTPPCHPNRHRSLAHRWFPLRRFLCRT
jgi:hypothetical protein